MPNEAEILEVASREVSPEFYREFEPITRGPVFAIAALIPLGIMAVAGLLWRKIQGNPRP